MKKYIYMAVAALAALSSCSSDNDLLSGEEALTFTATMEGSATRATYNSTEKCASWEAGDQISINGKTYNAQSAGLTTTFKAATPGQEAEGPTYNAYFACTYDGTTATLPAEVSEKWANGKFNMPMYATSEDTNLEFKNLCGVLKITVKNDQIDKVKKIKVSSATKAVSGAFTVTNNAAVLNEPNTVANTLTVTYTSAVTTTAEGVVFYVGVPAQTYRELKIELDDGNGFTESMTTKSETDVIIQRSKIYPISFVDKTTGSATIKGGGRVNWVQLWPGGPKFAEYNVGAGRATDLGEDMQFADATGTGDDYVWGANWRTPSKDEMETLMRAAMNASDDVECQYVEEGGTWGFKFTGKRSGYTNNSVFFPSWYGEEDSGEMNYWTSTSYEFGHYGYIMNFCWDGWLQSKWDYCPKNDDCYVRPVLNPIDTGDTDDPDPDEPDPHEPDPHDGLTTGTVQAIIDGFPAEVKWVRLWAGGPKFADRNVGASKATAPGATKTFTEASAEPFIWGPNWCTPRKADMNELFNAASEHGSTKVTCKYENVDGVWGLTFTGVETGYTTNSVFFPFIFTYGFQYGRYWVGPAIDSQQAWELRLSGTPRVTDWYNQYFNSQMFVRPVLIRSNGSDVPTGTAFTATMESDIDNSSEKCTPWKWGDLISINGKTYRAQDVGLTTTLKPVTAGQEAGGPTYNAYYACSYNGTTATLPAVINEIWTDGKFNMPMYATSSNANLQFKNLCGLLKITVKRDQINKVKKIRLSSANKAFSGAFTVTNNAAVLTNASNVANTLTVSYADAVPTTAEGKVFYVAVPAQTYQYLKIELSADGSNFTESMTTKKGVDIVVERNKVYPITFSHFIDSSSCDTPGLSEKNSAFGF